MRISDWSSDVCSSDLPGPPRRPAPPPPPGPRPRPADPGRQGRRFREGAAQPRGRARFQPVDPAAGAARTRSPGLAGHAVAGCLGQPDGAAARAPRARAPPRSEEHTSELQSLMRLSYAVFGLKKKTAHETRDVTYKTIT